MYQSRCISVSPIYNLISLLGGRSASTSRLMRRIGSRFSVSVKRLPSLGASLAPQNTDTQHGRFASKRNVQRNDPDFASRTSASDSFFKFTWLRIVVVRVVRVVRVVVCVAREHRRRGREGMRVGRSELCDDEKGRCEGRDPTACASVGVLF